MKKHFFASADAPELKNNTEDVSVNKGDDVTLDCGAEGYPAPAFHWSRDGVHLLETTNDLNITLATSAIYSCTATNYLGNVTKKIHVHLKKTNIMEAPAAITTPGPSTPRSMLLYIRICVMCISNISVHPHIVHRNEALIEYAYF